MSKVSLKQQLINQFYSQKKNIEIIPWIKDDEIGLSILKDYPEDGKFIPIRNKEGKHDSVALIKIGVKKLPEKNINIVPLVVSIHKASRYKFEHSWYNYDDEKSPSKLSVEKSEASIQPVDLEEIERYEFHIKNQKLYDQKIKKNLSAKQLVNNIYSKHLETLFNKVFRSKMKLRTKTVELIDPIISILKRLNSLLFGKKLKKSENFLVGIWQPYSAEDLTDFTLDSQKPKVLGSDFPITYQSATTFVSFVLSVYLSNYWFGYDLLGLVAIVKDAGNNSLFLASLVGMGLLFFDRGIPYFLLFLINLLIKFKYKLTFLKISI